jgi:hypothetical protein
MRLNANVKDAEELYRSGGSPALRGGGFGENPLPRVDRVTRIGTLPARVPGGQTFGIIASLTWMNASLRSVSI